MNEYEKMELKQEIHDAFLPYRAMMEEHCWDELCAKLDEVEQAIAQRIERSTEEEN